MKPMLTQGVRPSDDRSRQGRLLTASKLDLCAPNFLKQLVCVLLVLETVAALAAPSGAANTLRDPPTGRDPSRPPQAVYRRRRRLSLGRISGFRVRDL